MTAAASQNQIESPVDGHLVEATGRDHVPPGLGYRTTRPMIIHIVPQAHLDLAWFWWLDETVSMVLATFRGHVKELEGDRHKTFAHSQAWTYDVVRREDPVLFERVRALVRRGQWEPVGGEWVEPEHALTGHEALIRHFLYGQRFFVEHFGQASTVAWSPDGFVVHCGSLPQVLRQAGMPFLMHKRPRERYGHLPITPYYWRGDDGSEVLALRSNNKGVGVPSLSEGTRVPDDRSDLALIAEQFDALGLSHLWGPLGIGDTGGTNALHLPVLDLPVTPCFSTAAAFFNAIAAEAKPRRLPVISGSLPPAFTGACTSWWLAKRLNRECENRLQQAEATVTLAWMFAGTSPSQRLHDLWRELLLMQFHDIIGGCGTEHTRKLTEEHLARIEEEAQGVRASALRGLAAALDLGAHAGVPVLVVNPLGHGGDQWVEARVLFDDNLKALFNPPVAGEQSPFTPQDLARGDFAIEAVDEDGNSVPVQIDQIATLQQHWAASVRFLAGSLPPFGYRVFWIRPAMQPAVAVHHKHGLIETNELRVQVSQNMGGIVSMEHRGTGQRWVADGEPLGTLRLHESGEYPINYGRQLRQWEPGLTGRQAVVRPTACSWETVPGGLAVCFDYVFGRSRCRQKLVVRDGVDWIEGTLEGDWREVEQYLKLHFSATGDDSLRPFADQPYGWTSPLPDHREYAMQYLCGLEQNETALVVSNRAAYGCMWEPQARSLSISVIRCSTFPSERSDEGAFAFSYRLHLFATSSPRWKRQAWLAGLCTNVAAYGDTVEHATGDRSLSASLLAREPVDVAAGSLKPAYDADGVIIRLFNPMPTVAAFDLTFDQASRLQVPQAVDLLETTKHVTEHARRSEPLGPLEIRTLKATCAS